MTGGWELWRQGVQGNEFLVRTFDEREEAERVRDDLIARGHHQHYRLTRSLGDASPLTEGA